MTQLTTPPRQFAPSDFDAGDLAAIERSLDALQGRTLESAADVEQWLHDESEVFSLVAAELARRYIAMTCNTDSDAAKERFLQMEREISPQVKVRKDELDQKLLAVLEIVPLDPERYDVLIRKRRTAREIFREENTVLETEESELQTRQQALMGQLTVEFRGKSHTLQQMAPYFEDQDRDTRRDAYMASLEARRPVRPELEEILDELVGLRTRMARNAGFDSYIPFRFKQLERFDYDPATCRRFHEAIEHAVVPAVQRLDDQRVADLGIDSLRPWDLEVDTHGRDALRPFETEDQLVGIVSKTVGAVDARFAGEFAILRDEKLLDLMSRKGKAPGGYQYTLEDVRLPFIFTNGVGTHRDVQTLLHEAGHAFHAILSRDEPLLDYRDTPIEFAETASMSMELMGLEKIAAAYGDDDTRRARHMHFDKVLRLLPWIASIDDFQHWMYDNPDHDHAARKGKWLEIRARFAPGVDYSGIEDAQAYQWAGQPHLYTSPLYYIEYGIAQIASLQIWQNYRRDPDAAVRAYRMGLTLGGSRPLPELFTAAGARFDISIEMLTELVADVEAALAS